MVEDNVVSFPALPASGRPWVRIVSCNPAEVKDPEVPPTFSGYPAADRSEWERLPGGVPRGHWARCRASFSEFCRERGAPPLPELEFIHTSPLLNLWIYPPEVDYRRADPARRHLAQPRDERPRHRRSRGSCPSRWRRARGPLVYLSLGSLGSADVELMRKLIASLADARYRVIVSKGPQHDQLELAANMIGEEFLPQTSILPQVDAVITHGGNNTVTECLHFGKPMVVLPLFWDQYDNAQRMDETGCGMRLDTYGHEPAELRDAVSTLLADDALKARLGPISRRAQAAEGTVRAADLLEHARAADHTGPIHTE